jgi:hypothetical protein
MEKEERPSTKYSPELFWNLRSVSKRGVRVDVGGDHENCLSQHWQREEEGEVRKILIRNEMESHFH